jgi:hypothetical protein
VLPGYRRGIVRRALLVIGRAKDAEMLAYRCSKAGDKVWEKFPKAETAQGFSAAVGRKYPPPRKKQIPGHAASGVIWTA